MPGLHPSDSLRDMSGHVLITGASSGIGRALAVEMASRGYAVGLVARREKDLEELADEIRAQGRVAAWAVGDVVDQQGLFDAVGRLEDTLGPCEILVANAGIAGKFGVTNLDLSLLERVTEVNYLGAARAAAAVLPGMLSRQSGQLVVVSSVAGFRGLPGSGAYSASKAAVSTLWEAFRGELRSQGIACTTIHPGYIDTPLTQKNRFSMPFLMTVERAAEVMADGIIARRRQVNLPWRMVVMMTLIRWLPDAIYDRLMEKMLGPLRAPRRDDQSV